MSATAQQLADLVQGQISGDGALLISRAAQRSTIQSIAPPHPVDVTLPPPQAAAA